MFAKSNNLLFGELSNKKPFLEGNDDTNMNSYNAFRFLASEIYDRIKNNRIPINTSHGAMLRYNNFDDIKENKNRFDKCCK